MYYILRISNKAFIKLDTKKDSNDIIVVQEPERATRFHSIGDAMIVAAQINEDWEEDIVRVFKVG